MRGKSHIALGNYLIERYLPEIPGHRKTAFLLGCVQPDRNPATYLKGSLRCRWLRGHNYLNARPFMKRLSHRLEQKSTLNLFDYYTLGKLIHYTADAFTAPHNDFFPGSLRGHRQYETALQHHFLAYLHRCSLPDIQPGRTIMEGIYSYHQEYSIGAAEIARDMHFALHACCCVLAGLRIPQLTA